MCLLLALFIFHLCISLVTGSTQFCRDSSDCNVLVGTTCKNSQCLLCTQSSDSPRACPQEVSYGNPCSSDFECANDLVCLKLETGTCRCQRGRHYDPRLNKCFLYEEALGNKKYDLTRDVIIPSIILATLAITAVLCYKFFCNRKSWRRRRGADMARALEEAQLPHVGTSQPATWIASYRGSIPSIGPFISVFGTVERSGPPCFLLPVGPPPYEEALKHKVILSSCQPPVTTLAETTSL